LDRDLDNIKIKILVFQGKNDLKVYLEWEKKGWVDFLLSPLLWGKKKSKTCYYWVYWLYYYLVGSTCFIKEKEWRETHLD
jgi:hypothetical protein